MKERIVLSILGWVIGQPGLLGSDLLVQGSLVGTNQVPLSGHILAVSSVPSPRTETFRTNTDGSFSFEVEFSKRMLFVAFASGYGSEEYEIDSLPDSQQIKIDFTLPLTGAISGRVVDGTGKSQPGASVQVRYLDQKRRVQMGHGVNTRVDDAGDFTIFSVARGRPFVVDAVADDWLPGSSIVQTLDSESATGVIVTLSARSLRIRGKVVNTLGEPQPDILVRVRIKGSEVVGNEEMFARARFQQTVTDTEGRYEFQGLPRGNAIVVATRPGSRPVKEERELEESVRGTSERTATEINFVIP